MPLPSELKRARKQAELTQVQLASLSHVSQSVIAKIENGKVDPAYSTVLKLFEVLEKTEKKVKLVKDVMHRNLVVVSPSDLILIASRKMKKFGVSQLPVVSNGKLIGLIDESDILSAVEKNKTNLKVSDVISPAPPVVSSTVPASALPAVLRFSPIVCVVDNNKLVGVVTRSDLLTVF